MTWTPITAAIYALLMNVVGIVLFWKGRATVIRVVIASVVLAIFQYGCIFALDGFGWGWPDPSSKQITVLRLGAGLATGLGSIIFLLIATRAFSLIEGALLLILLPAVYLIDQQEHLTVFLIFEGAIVLISLYLASRQPNAMMPYGQT